MIDPASFGQGLLRAHVPQRPQQVSGHRQPGVPLEPRQAEVGDPELAAVVDQQVGWLDVPMEYALFVGVFQRLGRLNPQARRGLEEGTTPGR